MKRCFRCRTNKKATEFYKSIKNPDGLYSYCKVCARAQRLTYIHADLPEHYRKQRENTQRKRQVVWDYLSQHPCISCGERDPVVLEFDHVRGEKSFNVSDGIKVYSLERVLQEIAKCEVRCANCHRRITFIRRNQKRRDADVA